MEEKQITNEKELTEKIVSKELEAKEMVKNLCINCGEEKEDKKGTQCDACKALSNQEFYEITDYKKSLIHFRKVMKKIPEKEEKKNLKNTFKEAEEKNMVMGIMPSRCPYCDLLSKNSECITGFVRDSDEYKKFVIGKELPKLVCKRCGDLSLYLKWQYDFEHTESVKVLELVKELIGTVKARKIKELADEKIDQAQITQESKEDKD
jgi:hypothetical protein